MLDDVKLLSYSVVSFVGDLVKGHWHAHEMSVCIAEVVILKEQSQKCLQVVVFGIRFRLRSYYMHLKKFAFALTRI